MDNTTELCMIKYAFGEIFSSGGATLRKIPSDQTVLPAQSSELGQNRGEDIIEHIFIHE